VRAWVCACVCARAASAVVVTIISHHCCCRCLLVECSIHARSCLRTGWSQSTEHALASFLLASHDGTHSQPHHHAHARASCRDLSDSLAEAAGPARQQPNAELKHTHFASATNPRARNNQEGVLLSGTLSTRLKPKMRLCGWSAEGDTSCMHACGCVRVWPSPCAQLHRRLQHMSQRQPAL
jgi:hypothetical protein